AGPHRGPHCRLGADARAAVDSLKERITHSATAEYCSVTSNDAPSPGAPLLEVVITAQTRLYRNVTGDFLGTPAASGTQVQMVLVPYSPEQVAVGGSVIAWSQQRGGRAGCILNTRVDDSPENAQGRDHV